MKKVILLVLMILVTFSYGCGSDSENSTLIVDSSFAALTPDVYDAVAFMFWETFSTANNSSGIHRDISQLQKLNLGQKISDGKYLFNQNVATYIESGSLTTNLLTASGLLTEDFSQVNAISNILENLVLKYPESDIATLTVSGRVNYLDIIAENTPKITFSDVSCSGVLNGKTIVLSIPDGNVRFSNRPFHESGEVEVAINEAVSGSFKINEVLFKFTAAQLSGNKVKILLTSGSESVEFIKNFL